MKCLEHGRPIGRRVGVGNGSTDRAPVPDLGIADPGRRVTHDRESGTEGRILENAPVRRSAADPEFIPDTADAIEVSDIAKVDDQGRLGQAQLHQWEEAETAREDLGIPLPFLQDPQGFTQVDGSNVVEYGRNHRSIDPPMFPPRRGCVPPLNDGVRGIADRAGEQSVRCGCPRVRGRTSIRLFRFRVNEFRRYDVARDHLTMPMSRAGGPASSIPPSLVDAVSSAIAASSR